MGVSGSVCDTAEIARRIVGGCSSFGFLSFRVCLGVAGGGFIAGGLRAAGGGVSFPEVLGCAGDLAEGGDNCFFRGVLHFLSGCSQCDAAGFWAAHSGGRGHFRDVR